jgi:hypothetical protein
VQAFQPFHAQGAGRTRQFSIGDGCRGNRALRIDFVSHENLRSILLGHGIDQGQAFAAVRRFELAVYVDRVDLLHVALGQM